MSSNSSSNDDEKSIREMLKEYSKGFPKADNWTKFMTKDCLYIRPSGNPMSIKMIQEMDKNEDLNFIPSELKDIPLLHISGGMAYVTYINHEKFTYKGKLNDDVCVYTLLLLKTAY